MTDPVSIDRRAIPAAARLSTLKLSDGWPIRTMVWDPKGKPRGTILAANGRGDFMEKYIEIFGHFVSAGWRVAAFDWRGQGGSGRLSDDPAAGHIDDFALWIDDYAQLAEKLGGQSGPTIVFGHSMGGHLVLRALTESRVKADAAILSAPMLGVRVPGLSQGAGSMVARIFARIGDPRRRAYKGTLSGAEIKTKLTHDEDRYADEIWWREKDPSLSLGSPSWGWIRAAYQSILTSFTPERLARVKIPVLILNAEADLLVDAKIVNRVAAGLPNVTLVKFGPEASHELLREGDAVRLKAFGDIDGFLDHLFPR